MSITTDSKRFQQLWQSCLIDGALDDSAAIHQQLIDAYGEPQRHYHTLEHIEHCLQQFELIRDDAQSLAVIELAIWFHDVIFAPGAKDNELQSAEHFATLTRGIFDDSIRDTVYQLIMDTRHDGSPISDGDSQLMVDIDLSSIGLPWPEFLRDCDNLRREMDFLTDQDYYPRHLAFQNALLARSAIYLSDFFKQRYEARARSNMQDYAESVRDKFVEN